MPEWRPLPDAPRADSHGNPVAVRLHLPGVMYAVDESGRPKGEVKHGECVGFWDAHQSAWIDRASGAKVYPAGWAPLAESGNTAAAGNQ